MYKAICIKLRIVIVYNPYTVYRLFIQVLVSKQPTTVIWSIALDKKYLV